MIRTYVGKALVLVGLSMGIVALTGAAVLAGEGPANNGSDNSKPKTLKGPCKGSATLENGTVIDPGVSGGVYKVPLKGEANWQGAIKTDAKKRKHSGSVEVDLPWPLGGLKIASWGGEGTEKSNRGIEEYDVDIWFPAKAEFEVSGKHFDGGKKCSATVTVKADGNPFASATTYLALGGTVASGFGVASAAKGKRKSR